MANKKILTGLEILGNTSNTASDNSIRRTNVYNSSGGIESTTNADGSCVLGQTDSSGVVEDNWIEFFRYSGLNLKFNGNQKLATTSDGATITGNFKISGSGTTSSTLYNANGGISFNTELAGDASMYQTDSNGAPEKYLFYAERNGYTALYNDGSPRIKTSSTGAEIVGNISLDYDGINSIVINKTSSTNYSGINFSTNSLSNWLLYTKNSGNGDLTLQSRNYDTDGGYKEAIFAVSWTNGNIDFSKSPTSALAPVNDGDLTRKDYVDDNFIASIDGVGQNTHLRKYQYFEDYDDVVADGTGVKCYVRDGVWYVGKNTNELNDLIVSINGNVLSKQLIVSDTNGIQWESGRSRITHNEGGGNCQIRFGNYFSTTDKYTADSSSASYIGQTIDTENNPLSIQVGAITSGVTDQDTITWGTPLNILSTSFSFGSTIIYDNGTATLKASDSFKLGGVAESETATISTIMKRNSSGDVNARLFRSEHASSVSVPATTADIGFRNESGTGDNYMRFMTNTTFSAWCINSGVTFDSGSNANGYYIKYADGTMICRQNGISTSSTVYTTWTYPVAFIDTNVSVSGNWSWDDAYMATVTFRRSTTTSSLIRMYDEDATQVAGECTVMAIGKWK